MNLVSSRCRALTSNSGDYKTKLSDTSSFCGSQNRSVKKQHVFVDLFLFGKKYSYMCLSLALQFCGNLKQAEHEEMNKKVLVFAFG